MTGGRFGATAGRERPGPLAVIALVLLPMLLTGVLAAALSAPATNLDRVTAAIVNRDQPVEVQGQTVPLGRQFAAGLMAGEEPPPAPEATAAPEAPPAAGAEALGAPTPSPSPSETPGPSPVPTPEDGGESFTWVLTNADEADAGLASGRYAAVLTIPSDFSAAATSSTALPSEARQATFTVQTTPASAWLDPALSQAVTAQAATTLSEQLTQRYLAQVYGGFNEIDTQIGGASDGAAQLAAGGDSLAEGSVQLAEGLQELDAATATLPAQTAALAAGAAGVAGAVSAAAGRLDGAVASFSQTVATICETPGPVCERASAELGRLQQVARQMDTLAAGADSVADGNAALAAGMPGLVAGIDDATSGADQVSAGAAQVDAGATQLSQGLTDAVGTIPTFSDDDITVLSSVVAAPVAVEFAGLRGAVPAVPLFVQLALWVGGLAIALLLPAVPPRRLLTAASSAAIMLGPVTRTLALGAAGGVGSAAIVLGDVGETAGVRIAFVVAAAFVGAVFALVNQALVAVLGATGHLIAVAIGVLALVAAVSSTIPPVLTVIAGVLPTAAGLDLLVAAVTGPGPTVWTAEARLAMFAALAFVLVLAGTAARRSASADAAAQ